MSILDVLFFLVFFGTWIAFPITVYLEYRKIKKNSLLWENILECFKDVDFTVHTFSASAGGTLLESTDGTKHFYKVHSIDDAIKKLNLLKDGRTIK